MSVQQMDPKFQRLMEFAKNFKQTNKTSTISNLYVLQTVDRDGNVLDEKYGMNLFTNYGMSQYFVSKANFPTNLYIGNGAGSFNHTTNVLLSPIVTTAATSSSTAKSYNYPLYYDNIEGIITCVMKYMEVYFPYNVTGIDGPVDISEYGIGTSYNQLWTHSWVYNSSGQKSTIRKELNTRLDITVFMCMSYTTDLISDGIANGKYICITNMARFFNSSTVKMAESNLFTFRRNDYYERTKTFTDGYQDNIETITSNMGEFILLPMDQSNTTYNVYIDGFISWYPGFSMFERVTIPTAIPFDIIGKCLGPNIIKWDGFSYGFGDTASGIPFTQANVTGSYTYNYITGQYTCADHYLNNANKWYNEISFKTNFATSIWFTNNNEVRELKLYRNMRLDDPITAIDSAITTLYATDEYWNTSAWTRVLDLSSIPAALQNKKYWLTSDNAEIKPVRGMQPFEFIGSDDTTHSPTFGFRFADFLYGFGYTASDRSGSKKWFAIGQKIYVVSRGDVVVTSGGYTPFGYGDLVIHYTVNNNSAYFYETNITDATPTPTQTATLGSVIPGHSHITESENGYAIMSEYTTNSSTNGRTIKLDMTGSSVVQTLLDPAIDAACIPKSNNYAYIDKTEIRRVFVKKLSDDTQVAQIDIPSNLNAPVYIFGFKNYIYITDTSTYIWLYDVSTASSSQLSSTFPGSQYSQQSRHLSCVSCSDNCMVLYTSNMGGTYNTAWYVTANNPTTITSLTGLTDPNTNFNGCKIDVIDINTNSILMIRQGAIGSGSALTGFDLGKFIHDGTSDTISRNMDSTGAVVMWGEFGVSMNQGFPLANLLPHRIVGTTNTVTTVDYQKHVYDKRWTVEVTNLGSYNGLPPGTQQ